MALRIFILVVPIAAYKCEPKVERKTEVSLPHEDPEMEVPKEIELQYQYPMELRFPRKCRSIIPMVEFPSDIEEDRSLSPLTVGNSLSS